MKVKALDREWEVKDITFAQKRKLHALNAGVFWESKPSSDEYYKLLEKVLEYSELKEFDFKDLSMVEIDQILQSVFIAYLGLSGKV